MTRKLALFERETQPLVERYRAAGAEVLGLAVTAESGASDMAHEIVERLSDRAR